MPIIQLVFSYIGGPQVGVKNYLEVKGGVSQSTLVANAGIEGTLGGTFYLKFGGITFLNEVTLPDKAILSKVLPIMSVKNWVPRGII